MALRHYGSTPLGQSVSGQISMPTLVWCCTFEGCVNLGAPTIIGNSGFGWRVPADMFPGNSYSEHGDIFAAITRSLDIIGAAESALYPGKRPAAEIAIVYPRSSFMWDEWGQKSPTTIEDETNGNMDGRTTEYMAEIHGLFAVLAQCYNYPVDFIDEDNAANVRSLSRYQVVFVTEPSLPVESQSALKQYAASGGTVVLSRGAAMLDRYGQPSAVLGGGIDTIKPSPMAIESVWSLPNTANGSFATLSPKLATGADSQSATQSATPSVAFAAYGQIGRAAPTLPKGSTVLARFADRTPAAVQVVTPGATQGEGVIRLLWNPGLSWDHSGWLAGSGDFLRGILTAANARRPAWTNLTSCQSVGGLERGIETPLLIDSGNGAAMTLLNWCGENVTVTATAMVGFTVGSVTSAVTRASLSFKQDRAADGSLTGPATVVGVQVVDVDVLVFHRK
jgi:hypothetical protein